VEAKESDLIKFENGMVVNRDRGVHRVRRRESREKVIKVYNIINQWEQEALIPSCIRVTIDYNNLLCISES
jgi:hypothetical protein